MFDACFTFLAPAPVAEQLLARLAAYPMLTPDVLTALRELLHRYPPLAIAGCIKHACDELVAQGRAPGLPDHGEMDTYLALLDGLCQLGHVCQVIHHLAAA